MEAAVSIMDFFAASSFLIVFAVALLALLAMSIRVANQYERSVVFRLASSTARPGQVFISYGR